MYSDTPKGTKPRWHPDEIAKSEETQQDPKEQEATKGGFTPEALQMRLELLRKFERRG